MQIDNVLAKYQLIALTFGQDEVAANQTDVALFVNETAGPLALENVGYTMPFGGEIVGVSVNLSAAATGGTLTVKPTINTSACADPSAW